jgi:hypothetical protein
MKKIIVAAAVAVSALAGAAQASAEISNLEFLQAARCRGLAASEGLGKLDTAGIDAFLKTRKPRPRTGRSAPRRQQDDGAQKEGDKADGAKKEKLLAERASACSAWLRRDLARP